VAPPDQPRGEHPRVVHHQHVVRPEPRREVAHDAGRRLPRPAVEPHQPRRPAFGRGLLGNPVVGKVEVEVGDPHGRPALYGRPPAAHDILRDWRMKVWPGSPYPLGATWDGIGVNFALFSEHATAVELCLFDSPYAGRETHRIPLREHTEQVWHGYLPDVRPGQLYGYRVHGEYDPRSGHRFNPAKLLFDPHAKAVGRNVRWHESMFGFPIGAPDARDDRDNAAYAALAA